MKILNGKLIEETSEDIAIKEQTIADGLAEKNAELEKEKKAKEDADAKATLKASAKAKLVAGEALTQEEADTIVL